MRTRLLVLLPLLALAGPACGGDCAYGPSEVRNVAFTATAGAAIDESILFPEGSAGVFKALSPKDAPAGLKLVLADDRVKLGGSVAAAGTYAFQIRVQAEDGEACAPWARYDVTLTVE